MTKEEIRYQQQRLQAIYDCGNLVMNGSVMLQANLTRDYVGLWADRDDCTLAMPWGCYDGIEGVRRAFTVDKRDIRDDGSLELLKGSLIQDSLSAQVIELAEDGQTCRAVYNLNRMDTTPTNNEIEGLSQKAYWEWGWYGVDFIKTDDGWKIWHLRVFPVFKVPYGQDWAKYQNNYSFDLRIPTCDRPPMYCFMYNENQIFPDNYPALPAPYATFADVAPGYGYTL